MEPVDALWEGIKATHREDFQYIKRKVCIETTTNDIQPTRYMEKDRRIFEIRPWDNQGRYIVVRPQLDENLQEAMDKIYPLFVQIFKQKILTQIQ